MKKIFVFSMMFVFLVAVCVMAVTAAELKDKAVQHLDTAIQKRVALETKQYAGTWAQVLAERIADVNEITSNVALAKSAALEGIELTDPNNPQKLTIKDYMSQVIADRGKEPTFVKKQNNGQFLQVIEEIVSDPNNLPPETDPNYVDEMERLESLRAACIEIVEGEGGI
ncbi:MAG: hypothetical protein LLF76_03040 [Planctomycetaceae bacterium]|nr:hypothetical protein [Planctomycetaceae bacterium]